MSSKIPHFQIEGTCKTFLLNMCFFFMRIKSFHINSFALTLDLKQSLRQLGNCLLTEERIWPKKMSLLENSPSWQSNKKRIIKELQKKKGSKEANGETLETLAFQSLKCWNGYINFIVDKTQFYFSKYLDSLIRYFLSSFSDCYCYYRRRTDNRPRTLHASFNSIQRNQR